MNPLPRLMCRFAEETQIVILSKFIPQVDMEA